LEVEYLPEYRLAMSFSSVFKIEYLMEEIKLGQEEMREKE